MPEVFVLQSSENHPDRHQSPTIHDNDRHTPMPYENSNGRKPEVYYIGAKTGNEPIHNEPMHDEQPYKPSSPPINNSYPSSHNGPELYHLKVADDKDIPVHRPSPVFVSNNRVSPAFVSNNRISPMPYQNSNGQGPEMYYIKVGDGNPRQSPPIPKTKFNNNITNNDHITHNDNHDQQNISMYMLTTTDQENLPPPPPSRIQRTPSPPIRPTKKQQPVSYNIIDNNNNNNNKLDIPIKQRPFPTALHDVPTNVRYVPLSESKATDSIQRSMNKYRFGGS